jgi:hypothetical protein
MIFNDKEINTIEELEADNSFQNLTSEKQEIIKNILLK